MTNAEPLGTGILSDELVERASSDVLAALRVTLTKKDDMSLRLTSSRLALAVDNAIDGIKGIQKCLDAFPKSAGGPQT